MVWPRRMSRSLEVIEQTQIDSSLEWDQVALCDAHDLVAIINSSTTSEAPVIVYRLKGEVAFQVPERDDEDLRPLSLQWKSDGSLLAVNWSDQVCCLYSGENGKLLYELSPTKPTVAGDEGGWSLDINAHDTVRAGFDEAASTPAGASVSAPIIWTSYDDRDGEQKADRHRDDDLTTDNFLDGLQTGTTNDTWNQQERPDSVISRLVNAITTMDTTTVLPRLSRIEAATGMRHSPEGSKFSTQASTDTILHTSAFTRGVFSTLVTTDARGVMSVFVDETIKVGHLELPSVKRLRIASHVRCSSQVILAGTSSGSKNYLLNYVDLPLKQLGSPLSYVVSLNTKRLQSLMAYITHTVRCIHQEIQTGLKGVPARLMKLLEEDLRPAAGDSDLGTADMATIELQHLAMTSNFSPVMLEWLKDIVKETGHKRWEQAVNGMYDHIQSYIFKNLIPALQRYVCAVSPLRGQARFHQHTGKFDVQLEVFDNLLEWADVFSLVAEKTLQVVTEEHLQFKAFGKWLRVMIDVAVAGPGSKSADETEERESPNVDMDLCLRYINGPLTNSMLKILAESMPLSQESLTKAKFFDHPVVASMSRKQTTTILARLDPAHHYPRPRTKDDSTTIPHPSDPINLPLLNTLLKSHTRLAITAINAWQSQAVPYSPETIDLSDLTDSLSDHKVLDIAVRPPFKSPPESNDREIVSILAATRGGTAVTLLQVARPQASASGPRASVERAGLDVLRSDGGGRREGDVLHAALLPAHGIGTSGVVPAVVALVEVEAEEKKEWHLVLFSPRPQEELVPRRPPPPAWTQEIVHTWPSRSGEEGEPAFLTSPAHFILGTRPGKSVVVVFSPGPGGKGTRWEVLDLEGVFATNAGAEDIEDVDMDSD